MGPLATTDLTGVDILLHATLNIYADTQDEKFAPPELLRRMVDGRRPRPQVGPGLLRRTEPDPGATARAHLRVEHDQRIAKTDAVRFGCARISVAPKRRS